MGSVIRGYKYDHLIAVGSECFEIKDLVNAVMFDLKEYGCKNIGFHMPPFFTTGSPYGDALLRLAEKHGIASTQMPKDMDVAGVPYYGSCCHFKRTAMWPIVFDCDPNLFYPNTTWDATPDT